MSKFEIIYWGLPIFVVLLCVLSWLAGYLACARYEQSKPLMDDARRMDALAENSWDLRCFSMPTGQGDADIGWQVIEHHMGKPNERTVAEVFRDDPRQAIDAAIMGATIIKVEA